jgi:membrane protease YdiL (CAAX protease family)
MASPNDESDREPPVAGTEPTVGDATDEVADPDTPDGPKAKVVQTLIATIVGASGLAFLYLWGILILSLVAVVVAGEPSLVARSAVTVVATALGTATAAALYLRTSGRDWSFIDLEVPGRWDLAWGVGGIVGLLAMLYASGVAMDWLGIEQASHGTVRMAREDPRVLLVSIPASWLLIGPGEELLYRNVVQKSLYDVFSRRAAVVVATVIFAAVHFTAYLAPTVEQTLVSLVVVFLLALGLGIVFERTENLLVVAAVHGTFNAVQLADLYCELTGCGFVG